MRVYANDRVCALRFPLAEWGAFSNLVKRRTHRCRSETPRRCRSTRPRPAVSPRPPLRTCHARVPPNEAESEPSGSHRVACVVRCVPNPSPHRPSY